MGGSEGFRAAEGAGGSGREKPLAHVPTLSYIRDSLGSHQTVAGCIMMKVKVRKVGAVVLGASSLLGATETITGCSADTTSPDTSGEPDGIALGEASSAYSITNPGSALLTLNGTYGGWEYELMLSNSTTDEFVRSGETLSVMIPAWFVWQRLHADQWEEPALERVQKTKAHLALHYYRDGHEVSSQTLTTSGYTGEAYWILYATTESFVVPAGVDEIRVGFAFTDDDDAAATGSIDVSVVRPVTVFGGDLPDKTVLFDNDGQTLRQRILEGGAPVRGADLSVGYTDYRADTVVDASKLDRRIGKQQAYTRFGSGIADMFGMLVHEVSIGVYFDDGQGWREEQLLTAKANSTFAPQNWRTSYEGRVAIPSNATKMQVYYHIKTWLVADYSRYGGQITEKWYQDGQRILLAEKWDNPAGPSSNYDLGVEAPEQNDEMRRTVVFVKAETEPGQDLFLRGGIDHAAAAARGIHCTNGDGTANFKCALPITHLNHKNPTTNPWKVGDKFLDWYGQEGTQTGASHGWLAQGSAADWTTNAWPQEFGAEKTVATDGYGIEPLNTYGLHYWMLDVMMDCSKAYEGTDGTRWFEVKSFVSNGPGWEPDVQQTDAPYASPNHFAKCGQVSVFERGSSSAVYVKLP